MTALPRTAVKHLRMKLHRPRSVSGVMAILVARIGAAAMRIAESTENVRLDNQYCPLSKRAIATRCVIRASTADVQVIAQRLAIERRFVESRTNALREEAANQPSVATTGA